MVNERSHKEHQQVNLFFCLRKRNVKARKNAEDTFVNLFSHLVLEPSKRISSRGYTPYDILRRKHRGTNQVNKNNSQKIKTSALT